MLGRVLTTSLVCKARKAISAVLEPSGQARASHVRHQREEVQTGRNQSPAHLYQGQEQIKDPLLGVHSWGYDNRVTAIYLGSFVCSTPRPVDINTLGSCGETALCLGNNNFKWLKGKIIILVQINK